MKKYFRSFLLFVLLISPFSCSEDFLSKPPMGETSENIFYNEKGIDALLIGAYAMVRGSSQWEIYWGASIQNWIYGSVASDDAYKGSENTDSGDITDFERWTVLPTNKTLEDKWKWAFGMGIFRCNQILKVLERSKQVPEEKLAQFSSEARFLSLIHI